MYRSKLSVALNINESYVYIPLRYISLPLSACYGRNAVDYGLLGYDTTLKLYLKSYLKLRFVLNAVYFNVYNIFVFLWYGHKEVFAYSNNFLMEASIT